MFNFYIQRHVNIKDDVLSGLTVALALIPEAVAFSFVAGVEPLVGLYAAFIVGLITAVAGGRPGMISGATGALAVVMIELVAKNGVEYLFAAVILMGIIYSDNCRGIASGQVHQLGTSSGNAGVCQWPCYCYNAFSVETFSAAR